MDEVVKVSVIEVGEDAEELSVEVPSRRGKGRAEFATCFRREDGFVADQFFRPGQDKVCACGQTLVVEGKKRAHRCTVAPGP